MNGFNDTHPQKATDHTVLMVYNTSIDTKIFTCQLPGWCESSLSLYNFTFSVSPFESVTSDLHFTCPSFKLAMGGININNGPVRASAHVEQSRVETGDILQFGK